MERKKVLKTSYIELAQEVYRLVQIESVRSLNYNVFYLTS